MDIAPRRSQRRSVSLTPLIDVVFILLLFFMLASSFSDWTAVELGSGSGTRAAGDEGALVIHVGANDTLSLGGVPVAFDDLGERLSKRLAGKPDKPVAVTIGEVVALQRVITVMDVARRAGAGRVTLVGE